MELPNWDIIQSAAGYSTLTGILAGFALTAVTVVVTSSVTRRERMSAGERDDLETTLAWLITSFFTLLLVSFLFAVLSGHDRYVTTVDNTTHQLVYGPKTLQPVYLGLPASVLFASAAMQLVLGLVWLLAFLRLGWLPQFAVRVVFWFMLPLTVVHVHSFYSILALVKGQTPDVQSISYWADAAVAILVPCAAFIGYRVLSWFRSIVRGLRRRLNMPALVSTGQHNHASATRRTIRKIAVIVSLVLTLFIAVVFGIGENLPEKAFSHLGIDLSGFNWVVFGLLAALWTLYALSLPVTPSSSSRTAASSDGDAGTARAVEAQARIATPPQ